MINCHVDLLVLFVLFTDIHLLYNGDRDAVATWLLFTHLLRTGAGSRVIGHLYQVVQLVSCKEPTLIYTTKSTGLYVDVKNTACTFQCIKH